jgi:D-serine deaminase-like pyridoxal phosphate-dependent protein
MTLDSLDTPAAVIDVHRMNRNIASMQARMNALGVKFRPHVKTSKCVDVVKAQLSAGAQGITVSTLKEAEAFFAAGITDILYAVSIVPARLPRVMALRKQGCDLKIIVDNVSAATGIVAFCRTAEEPPEVWIEVDTDGHRSGIKPEEDALLEIGRILQAGGITVGGVITHAGSSYDLNTQEALAALAERNGPVACAPHNACATPAFSARLSASARRQPHSPCAISMA